MPERDRETIVRHAQERSEDRLLALPNVIGVATGLRRQRREFTDEVVIQVFVHRKVDEERLRPWEVCPTHVPGYEGAEIRTDVVETTIPDAQQDTTRYRPVPGGCSIGAEARINAGTLGGWACDSTDDTTVLLSNNHVISNLDTMPALTRVVQPGRFDGGTLPDDVIGDLKRHVPVNTVATGTTPVPTSVVDAAIADIDANVDIDHDVLAIGPAIYEVRAPALRMNVQKRGRTTQQTTNSRITSVGMTFLTNYRNRTRQSQIQNAFRITSTDGNLFSDSGDSGSLIFDQAEGELEGTRPVVGLLYAGGTFNDGTPFTDANDINAVMGALDLETICACLARALIEAVFGSRTTNEERTVRGVRDRERQIRRFRRKVLRESEFGQVLDHMVRTRAATAGRVLAESDEAFDLAVRALRPLREARSIPDLLRTPVDTDTIEALQRFAEVVGERDEELGRRLATLSEALRQLEGSTLETVLRAGADQLDQRRKGD